MDMNMHAVTGSSEPAVVLYQLDITDPTNPQFYVGGKLTVCARLTVAFFFSAFMFLCILLVCGLMRGGGAAEDAEDEAQRSKMRVSASRLALAGAGGGAAPAALATEEEGVFT